MLRSRGDGIAARGAAGLRLRRAHCLQALRAVVPATAGREGSRAPAGGRLMSCEKRAVGVSEHTWSQISSV